MKKKAKNNLKFSELDKKILNSFIELVKLTNLEGVGQISNIKIDIYYEYLELKDVFCQHSYNDTIIQE